MDVALGLNTYAQRIDARLAELLPPAHARPEPLHQAMRYAALSPGKRLRPALVLESARAVGGDPETVLDAACAVELIHAFSLIHDDLPALDNDVLRRGRPTCHVQFGEATAILAGDALFALAFQAIGMSPAAPERVVEAISLLARTAIELVQGESQDILSEQDAPDAEILEFIHRRKTGSLIACSCTLGALLGGADREDIKALQAYGEHLGLAFQIADDVLNETASAEQLGKSAGSDRERGKMTYPAVFGLDAAQAEARRESDRAIAALSGLKGPTDLLEALARFTIERSS